MPLSGSLSEVGASAVLMLRRGQSATVILSVEDGATFEGTVQVEESESQQAWTVSRDAIMGAALTFTYPSEGTADGPLTIIAATVKNDHGTGRKFYRINAPVLEQDGVTYAATEATDDVIAVILRDQVGRPVLGVRLDGSIVLLSGPSAGLLRSAPVAPLDLAVEAGSGDNNLRIWNKGFTPNGSEALLVTQKDSGAIYLIRGFFDPGILMIPASGAATEGLDAGVAIYFAEGYSLVATARLSDPPASAVTQFGTAGVAAVTYRLVGRTPLGYQTAAGAASSTTTANATQTGGHYNVIARPVLDGVVSYDIWRTSGGASQGKIASAVPLASFPFHDTGQAGDSADADDEVNTTGRIYAEARIDANGGLGSSDGSAGATGDVGPTDTAHFKDGLYVGKN